MIIMSCHEVNGKREIVDTFSGSRIVVNGDTRPGNRKFERQLLEERFRLRGKTTKEILEALKEQRKTVPAGL